jgi:hypothetical protein
LEGILTSCSPLLLEHDLRYTFCYQVDFSFSPEDAFLSSLPGVYLEIPEKDVVPVQTDFALEVQRGMQLLHGQLTIRSDLFSPEAAGELLAALQHAILTLEPADRIHSLPWQPVGAPQPALPTVHRLLALIRLTLNIDLPISAMSAPVTVTTMLQALRAAEAPPWFAMKPYRPGSPLVAIQEQGTRPPLFCFHPVGGDVGCYTVLKRYLADQPIYGLQAQGLDGSVTGESDLAQLARIYLATMQEVSPTEPHIQLLAQILYDALRSIRSTPSIA